MPKKKVGGKIDLKTKITEEHIQMVNKHCEICVHTHKNSSKKKTVSEHVENQNSQYIVGNATCHVHLGKQFSSSI